MTTHKEVMIYAERLNGGLHRISLELSALGRKLADEFGGVASAILIGDSLQSPASELISYGMDKVYVAEEARLQHFQPEAHAAAIEQVCQEVSPSVLLFGHTLHGVDLAPRLGWRLRTGVVTNSVEFRIDPDSKRLLVARPVYGAKALAVMSNDIEPLIATLRSKTVSPATKDETRKGEIVSVQVRLEAAALRIKYVERIKEEVEGPKLEDAEVVVSGGRGIGRKENFAYLQELASILGGAVGGSRVAIDNGWLPSSRQVGLTGTVVSPRLYFAIGISGAAQHLAGCASSQCIVAINTDPDAPIFKRARFGIVADYKEVLPTLIKVCKEG
jgi:electron transfer flavoprotein alpha subunit